MRNNESAILEIHFFIIHYAAIKSADKDAFLKSLSTNTQYFQRWCDAVTHAHQTPMSYDILKKLTEKEVEINYHAKSSYPLPKTLKEIHTLLYKKEHVKDCLKKLDYTSHYEFYKTISQIEIEDRYLTHVDLMKYDAQSLEEMIGKDVYNAPLMPEENPEKKPSRINLTLINAFIQHFNCFKHPITKGLLASYLNVKSETLDNHLKPFKDRTGKSLDFETLIKHDLKDIEAQFIKTEKSKKKTTEAIVQIQPVNISSVQKRKAADADANVYAPKTGNWTQSDLLQTSFNPQPSYIAIPPQTPLGLNDYPGTFFMPQAPICLPQIGFSYAHSSNPAYQQPPCSFFSQSFHDPMPVQDIEKDYFTEQPNAAL